MGGQRTMSLNLISVNKSFGDKQVIEELDLRIPKGEVFGFLGPNGAGKTTTMRMILDIIRPDSGQITWQDKIVGLATARTFGYLPEERGLYPKMVVAEQMNFFARLRGLSKAEAAKRIGYWSERFQLGELVKKKANELSKGNQQKIQFIIAILHQPELLILDEPFSGLDPVNVELLNDFPLDLAKLSSNINRQESGETQVVKEVEFDLPKGIDPQAILQVAIEHGQIKRFEIGDPSLNEVFITLVGGDV